jgi:ATP/maltotriose-dependent transcriptional regulator MalT
VASHEEEAGMLYANARAAAELPKLRRIAALGELVAAIELERGDAPELLGALETDDVVDPTECLILADRRLSFEIHFALRVDIERARASAQLLPLVGDPLARTSFRNVFGYALAATGHFDEALDLTGDQLEDAEHHRLEFVLPYAYSIQALAKAGLRSYLEAQELLDEAEQRALKAGDRTAYHIAWAIRVRTYIAQGAFDLVLERALSIDGDLTRQLRSELTASYSLAVAGASNPRLASDLADDAQRQSIGTETQIMARLTHALIASRTGDRTGALVHATGALQTATRTGLVESFVFGCRGCPEILVSLLEDQSLQDDISRILTIAGDRGMAGSLAQPSLDHSILTLSPREKEVLSLVSQGLSNREIGLALFISPVTVKVHVRHIFEKLGVKSRAAAAIRASQLGR